MLSIAISGAGNKKGRGETAPTFLTSLLIPVPVHPWSKAESNLRQIASGRRVPALISNADVSHIGIRGMKRKLNFQFCYRSLIKIKIARIALHPELRSGMVMCPAANVTGAAASGLRALAPN
ncbi:hypothetical protein [Rhizobium mesoamericanum]|uniref:hypothetical protein n=1 Tax=Rhizobium mesoamericanum TaxID=1079800 RepID=UPI0012FBCA5F|nr:hypothetical protein [Rhizobium mesoamericanum]